MLNVEVQQPPVQFMTQCNNINKLQIEKVNDNNARPAQEVLDLSNCAPLSNLIDPCINVSN